MDKSFRIQSISLFKDWFSGSQNFGSPLIVDSFRRKQLYCIVVVVLVVPDEKLLTETLRILNATKSFRESRVIFQGFESALWKGIVIADLWSAKGFNNA